MNNSTATGLETTTSVDVSTNPTTYSTAATTTELENTTYFDVTTNPAINGTAAVRNMEISGAGLLAGLFMSGVVCGVIVSTVTFCLILKYKYDKKNNQTDKDARHRTIYSHDNRSTGQEGTNNHHVDINNTSSPVVDHIIEADEREVTVIKPPNEHVAITVPQDSLGYDTIDNLFGSAKYEKLSQNHTFAETDPVPEASRDWHNDLKPNIQDGIEKSSDDVPIYHILEKPEYKFEEPAAIPIPTCTQEYFFLLKQEETKVICKEVKSIPDYLTLVDEEPTETPKTEINSSACYGCSPAVIKTGLQPINAEHSTEDGCASTSGDMKGHRTKAVRLGNEHKHAQDNREAPITTATFGFPSLERNEPSRPSYNRKHIAMGFLAARRMSSWARTGKQYNLAGRHRQLKNIPKSHGILEGKFSKGESDSVKQFNSESHLNTDGGKINKAFKREIGGRVNTLIRSFSEQNIQNVEAKGRGQRNIRGKITPVSNSSNQANSTNLIDTLPSDKVEEEGITRTPTYANFKSGRPVAAVELEQKTLNLKEQPDSTATMSSAKTKDNSISSTNYENYTWK